MRKKLEKSIALLLAVITLAGMTLPAHAADKSAAPEISFEEQLATFIQYADTLQADSLSPEEAAGLDATAQSYRDRLNGLFPAQAALQGEADPETVRTDSQTKLFGAALQSDIAQRLADLDAGCGAQAADAIPSSQDALLQAYQTMTAGIATAAQDDTLDALGSSAAFTYLANYAKSGSYSSNTGLWTRRFYSVSSGGNTITYYVDYSPSKNTVSFDSLMTGGSASFYTTIDIPASMSGYYSAAVGFDGYIGLLRVNPATYTSSTTFSPSDLYAHNFPRSYSYSLISQITDLFGSSLYQLLLCVDSRVFPTTYNIGDIGFVRLRTPSTPTKPTPSGTAAFRAIANKAISSGTVDAIGNYSYRFYSYSSDGFNHYFYVDYNPVDNEIMLELLSVKGSFNAFTSITLTSSIPASYLAGIVVNDYGGVVHVSPASYTYQTAFTASSFYYYDGPSSTKPDLADVLSASLPVLLQTSLTSLFSSTAYTLKDFGFTKLSSTPAKPVEIKTLKLADASTGKSISKATAVVNGTPLYITAQITPANAEYDLRASYDNTYFNVEKQSDGLTFAISAKLMSTGSHSIVIRDNTSGKSASLSVTLQAKAESLRLSQSELVLQTKKSATLSATLNAGCKDSVLWESSDPSVATVSKGKVTAKAGGTCTITARASSDPSVVYDTCSVHVIEYISKISMDKSAKMTTGDQRTFTATITPYRPGVECDLGITASAAGISAELGELVDNGNGTASIPVTVYVSEGANVTKGTVTIADRYSKKSAKCSLSIVVKATSLTLNLHEANLIAKKSVTLKAILNPSASKEDVLWGTSDPSVATVSKGKVVGVGPGTCTITAYTLSGCEDFCEVTVLPQLKSFALYNSSGSKVTKLNAFVGDAIDLSALITGQSIVWADGKTYSDEDVPYTITYTATSNANSAVVDSDGHLVLNGAGSVKVTVSFLCGTQKKDAKITITVK